MAFQQSPRRRSQTRFSKAPQANVQRSSFDLSHPYKTTFDSGLLIPVFCQEVLPGDSWRVRMASLCRIATPLHPTMDNLHLESFFFFIPNRLVWNNWQKFMGEQDNPGDSTDYVIPIINHTPAELQIYDYFGLPTGVSVQANALPFRGYNLCVNEWFRDENLQDSLEVPKHDGPDGGATYNVFRRGKRKDYISSSLPWPQKGPGVDVPLGGLIPVEGIAIDANYTAITSQSSMRETGRATEVTYSTPVLGNAALPDDSIYVKTNNTDGAGGGFPQIYANADRATAFTTINDLRQAFQIQKLQERDARGGTRYTEILKSHFQVISPDSRLQRPEYLGGGHSPVQMNTVPQTSQTDPQGVDASPQGNLTAYGTSMAQNHGFTKSFVEHGYILGIINVRADLNYQQRLDRHWTRQTKYDFYWPALQSLGEQPVYNREVYMDGTAQDDEVWGYQERWAEYRSQLGKITGRFRSNAAAPLDAWHYALDFGETRPTLSSEFIQDNPPVRRTVAVDAEPEFIFDAWFDIKAARPMPIYSVPGYIDHF